MRKRWTRKACFDFFGVAPRNQRWSWSGRSPDGEPNAVAVALWQDRFLEDGRVYRSKPQPDEKWFGSPGHKELIENLAWARDNCDGRVRVITVIVEDKDVSPRSIRECLPPHDDLGMRVVSLDESAMEFVLERIDLMPRKPLALTS
jgi:hypothetical protein